MNWNIEQILNIQFNELRIEINEDFIEKLNNLNICSGLCAHDNLFVFIVR